ncbi:MAG TPA: hypothetical protein VMZ28_29970 [Kofleriaceae bacterium]|nr:hypothetical protein [Kofleriaceae bacterium]
MKTAAALPLALLLAACGGGDDDEPGGPDGGGDDPSIPEPGTPILDRESPGTHACEVLDAPAEVAGSTLGAAIAVVDGAPLVARTSYGPLGDDEFGHILGVTPASFSPMGLGEEAYRKTQLATLRLPALAASGDGAVLAWAEGDYQEDQSIFLARLDAAGDVIGAPQSITAGGTVVTVAATAGQVAWVDDALHVQPLDDGAPDGDASLVRTARMNGAALAPAGDGLALVWTEVEGDPGVHLALLDASGAVTAGPLRVSGALPELTFVDAPAVIAAGDELLVAWSEHFWDEDTDGHPETFDPRGHSIIRVARVSGDGERVLAFEGVQAVEDDIIHLHPAFAAQEGGAVALSWSRGTFIPVCGGCISDNTRLMIVLEPHDLVPLSGPIEMEGPSGFSSATMTAVGDDLVHLLGLDYHAISTTALARTRCAAN